MKLFHWKIFLLIIVIYVVSRTIAIGLANQYFGLYAGMYLDAIYPLIIIIYVLAWVYKWNKGEAKFF